MSTNLAGDVAIGKYDLCYLRAGRLDASCYPVYGTNGGVITSAITSMTASAEIETGATNDFKNGCGTILTTVKKADKIKRRNLSGVLTLWDYELFELLFGGTLIYGKNTYSGKVIGWAEPGANSATKNPVVLEVITQAAGEGEGSCAATGGALPYQGHIFPKSQLTVADVAFAEGVITVNFTGSSENNPNYGSGPWRDWDEYSATVFPTDSAMVNIGYSDVPLASDTFEVRSGYQDTPAAS